MIITSNNFWSNPASFINKNISQDVKDELIDGLTKQILSKLNTMNLCDTNEVSRKWNQLTKKIVQETGVDLRATKLNPRSPVEPNSNYDPNNDSSTVSGEILARLLGNFFKKNYVDALYFLMQIENKGGQGWVLSCVVKMTDDFEIASDFANLIEDTYWKHYTLEWLSNNAQKFVK